MIDEKIVIEEIKDWQNDIHDNEHDASKFDFVFDRIYEIVKEQPKVNEWIPITEMLPEEDGEYLVYYSQEIDKSVGDECECGYSVEMYDAEQKAFGCWNLVLDGYTLGVVDDEFTSMDTVVAWMQLPKPYEEKENE